MISNISFGSTYKVSSNNNTFEKTSNFQDYAAEQSFFNGVHTDLKITTDSKYPYNTEILHTLIVPDEMDSEVEAFCAKQGIKFNKSYNEDLLNVRAISRRIKPAPENMIKVEIDADRLTELMKKQQQNIDYCENVYHKYFKDKVDKMLKTGEEIPATTFCIMPRGNSIEETLEYIDTFGAKNLNHEQLFIGFDQRTQKPDHCVFFALKEMGMKNIPVYVESDTYEIANALGILK